MNAGITDVRSALSRCGRKVASATDGRTVRGARDESINALVRAGVDPTMATRMTLAMVRVGQRIGDVARGVA